MPPDPNVLGGSAFVDEVQARWRPLRILGPVPAPICDCPDEWGLGDCSGKCPWYRVWSQLSPDQIDRLWLDGQPGPIVCGRCGHSSVTKAGESCLVCGADWQTQSDYDQGPWNEVQ